MKIKEGIHLHILPTKKFKTIVIQLRFKAFIKESDITKRSLLSNMLDVNSKQYPTQRDFRKRLSELYGANFFTDVSRYGNYHIVTLNMECVDENIVNETSLLTDVIEFLKQVIFSPHAANGQFDKPTFFREIEKLRDDYASRFDDKLAYAEDNLNRLYFETNEQKMTSYGQESDLNQITPANLFDCYLKMIQEDQIDVFVTGNISEEDMVKKLASFNFEPREDITETPFYVNEKVKAFVGKNEIQKINQTIVTMGLKTPIYFDNQDYYIGIVFNGLFGSMPHSKLFQTIREQHNLAYSISSELDAYRGMLLVYAGVENTAVNKVVELVLNQLIEIQIGNFSEKELALTKEILKNEIIQVDDTAYALIEKVYNFTLVGQEELTLKQWIEKIDQVSREEVMKLAQQIIHQATFILIGEND